MLKFLRGLFQSEFSRNAATLTAGTTLAHAIPIAVSPILTRLYSPEDFGVLALFTAITAILGAVASGKYEMAIMLPKKELESLNILYLSILISFSFSIIILILILLLKKNIVSLLGEPQIEPWLYFIPFCVFFVGLFNSLNIYNTRLKKYKQISAALVTKSSGLTIAQLSFGLAKSGAMGLIIGQIVSYILGNYRLLKISLEKYSLRAALNFDTIKDQAKRYKKFPQLTLPGTLLNSMSLNIINFLITGIYSTFTLGLFSLANRMLGVPIVVIGKSMSQVFFQEITDAKNNQKDVRTIFTSTVKKLMVISAPVFLLIFFLAEPVFAFVFGPEWEVAGTYARIIAPLAWVRFISSSVAVVTDAFEKQNIILIFNIALLTFLVSSFMFCKYYELSFNLNLIIYCGGAFILYLLLLLANWSIIKNYTQR